MITLKLLILGNSGVGKTSLLLNATENDADTANVVPTIGFELNSVNNYILGVDFKSKDYFIENERICLQLWDTAGHERFKSITQAYYRGSHGIMVVYDITDVKSFQDTKSWISTIKEKCDDDINIILVGNKMDLVDDRLVTEEDGKSLAEQHEIRFMELSAFRKEHLNEKFKSIVEDLYDRHKKKSQVTNVTPIKKKEPKKLYKKCTIS